MQTLDLNLSARPFRNNTLLWAGYGGALVLLIAFTSWNVFAYRTTTSELAAYKDAMVNLDQTRRDLDQRQALADAAIRRFDLETLSVQAAKANEVIEWKAFSWTRLFNRLAETQPYGVKMTSVRPVFRGGRGSQAEFTEDGRARAIPVLIEGVARDYDDFWELQNALLESDYFGRVDPERLNRAESKEVLFQLRFTYFPGDEGAPAPPAEVAEAAASPGDETGEEAAPEPPPVEGEPLEAEPPRRKLPAVATVEEPAAEVEPPVAAPAPAEQLAEPVATAEPPPAKPAPAPAATPDTADEPADPAATRVNKMRGRQPKGKGKSKIPLRSKGREDEGGGRR